MCVSMLMTPVVRAFKCVSKLFCAQPVARGRCLFVPCQRNLKKKRIYSYLIHSFQSLGVFVGPASSPMPKKTTKKETCGCDGVAGQQNLCWVRTDSVRWCEHAVFSWKMITLRTCTQPETVSRLCGRAPASGFSSLPHQCGSICPSSALFVTLRVSHSRFFPHLPDAALLPEAPGRWVQK